MTSELKVKAAGGHFGSISSKDNGDPLRRERLISQLVRRIDLLRGRAGRLGLDTLLWEPMPTFREPPSSVKETRDLLSAANRDGGKATVKLCIDVGHACNPELSSTRDADPYYWLEELAKDSPCVHIQQTDGTSDRHWPFTPKFNRLGIVKPEKIIASLDKSGAEEVGLFLEIVPPFEQPDEDVLRDLKQSVRYWKEYL